MILTGGGHIPGRGPAPDVIVVLCLIPGNLDIDGLLNGFGIVFCRINRTLVGNFGEGSVSVVGISVIGFVVIHHLAGTLYLDAFVVVQHAVIVVNLIPRIGLFRSLGKRPAGFAEHFVFFNIDVPDPLQAGYCQVTTGFVPVHPDKEGDDGQQDDQENSHRAAALCLRGGNLGLGGGFRRFPFLFLLQHLEVVALGIFPAGSAVVAELGIIAVQGITEGTVPVRVFADVFGLLFIQVFDIRPFVFFPGFAFVISLHIELDVSAGTAAGRAVCHIAADLFCSADRTVPVSHDEFRHDIRSFDQTLYIRKNPVFNHSHFTLETGFPSTIPFVRGL